eukprot:11743668-Alexandrium_andersonii.AAC.1
MAPFAVPPRRQTASKCNGVRVSLAAFVLCSLGLLVVAIWMGLADRAALLWPLLCRTSAQKDVSF